MSSPIAKTLCKFVVETKFDDLPSSALRRMKSAILDTVGCIIFGSTTTSAKVCMDFVKPLDGKKEATVIGTNMKTSCLYATLINGTMGHRLDFDDGITGNPHAGITIIPAALAIAERERSNGKDLLTATNLGYELMVRITRSMGEGSKLALHSNCFGALGAAAATGKLLEFDLEEMTNAIGICGALIPAFPFEPFVGGAMIKDFYGGWPGFIGIMSALLAQQGMTGLDNILEARRGFYQVFSGGDFDKSLILGELGNEFVWMKGHYIKRYSACRNNHVAVDCILKLAKEHKIRPEDVEEILVLGRKGCDEMRGGIAPKNDIAARASINYTVAAAIICGHLGVDAFDRKMLSDPRVIGLSRKVRVFIDPTIPGFPHKHGPVEIFVKFRSGKPISARIEDDSSLTEEETVTKFENLSSRVFPAKQTRSIVKIVNSLETVDNIGQLTDLLRSEN